MLVVPVQRSHVSYLVQYKYGCNELVRCENLCAHGNATLTTHRLLVLLVSEDTCNAKSMLYLSSVLL